MTENTELENTIAEETKEETTKITEEQIQEIHDTLEKDIDPNTQTLRKVLDDQKKDEDEENLFPTYEELEKQVLEEGTVSTLVDSDTGETQLDLANVMEDPNKNDTVASTKNEYGLNDEDMMAFLDVVKRYSSGEKFGVYAAMPETIKHLVFNACINFGQKPTNPMLNKICREVFLDEFISNLKMDQEINKFNEELKELTGSVPDIADIYSDALKEAIVDKNLTKADELEATNPIASEKLRKVANTFKQTYEYTYLYDYLNTSSLTRYRKSFKDSIFKREIDSFKFTLSKCTTFHIPDPNSLMGILRRYFTYSDRVYQAFIMLIKYATEDLDLTDIYNAELVNYTIRNIVTLDNINSVKSDFNKTLIANIDALLSVLTEKFDTKVSE